jgi:hypothetical protein
MSRLTSIIIARGGGFCRPVRTGPAQLRHSHTPPINPAAGSTNPSALATQSLNPYLGSIPGGS